ncbi:hypothetical protein ACHAP5_005769 [Fusarium lateritium]
MAEPDSSPKLSIDVEFSGGLEMLFSNKRQHALVIPAVDQDGKPANIANLIDYLCQNVMDDTRKDLFVLDNHLTTLVQTTDLTTLHPPIHMSNLIVPVADKSGKQSARNPGTHQ